MLATVTYTRPPYARAADKSAAYHPTRQHHHQPQMPLEDMSDNHHHHPPPLPHILKRETDPSLSPPPQPPPGTASRGALDLDFLHDLRSLVGDGSRTETERLAAIDTLVAARIAWTAAGEGYMARREDILGSDGGGGEGQFNAPGWGGSCREMGFGQATRADAWHSARRQSFLTSLPDDLILTIIRHLEPASLGRVEASCRKMHSIITHYSQSLWRHLTAKVWGVPTAPHDPRLSGYFIPKESDWKTVFEERHNLYTGQYRFRMIADLEGLASRSRRQELVEERKDVYARKTRKYVLHCGQPTTMGSGYAVNLRLCGPYMLWISNNSLAACKIDGHTAHYLEHHTAPVIALATNHRDLAVTAAEDTTMCVWDLERSHCVRVLRGVDVLDCAIHENVLVSYNNDNVIDVWDVREADRINRIDVRLFGDVDSTVLTREVKIAVWGDNIVCGFENTVFLVICRIRGILKFTLSEPAAYHRDEFDSTSYPTVLAMYDNILFSRGVRCHEICVWNLDTGELLYRLSESISFQTAVGHPIRPSEVITDFTLDSRGSFLMCTVENEGGDVYLLAWDFRKAPRGGEGVAGAAATAVTAGAAEVGGGGVVGAKQERERRYEKRSLEGVAGEVRFEYTNFWLCYEV
ncbi:hypothetical protein HDU87_006380 [Geranomyces variabilis]|uniref:F-box domain-containing protein n=1 Tax=Geranomyces variabilis TaxID=109894 RepID=A0AAD5TFT1_9FUNG|nr:hypothetical protein HDU87_006380 [Geranomyces variabilis]